MKRFEVVLRTHTLVAAGRRYTRGQFLESHDYIPGSVFRGAVAGDILRHCPDRCPGKQSCEVSDCPALASDGRCLFPDIFLGENAFVFTSLYPYVPDRLLGPMPLTVRTCKHCPGSQTAVAQGHAGKELPVGEVPHGVWDTLVDTYRLQREGPCPTEEATRCVRLCRYDDCTADAIAPREHHFAMHWGHEFEGSWVEPVGLTLMRQTRVAINRRRWAAEDQMLYSVVGVGGEQELGGAVLVPEGVNDEAAEALDRALSQHSYADDPLLLGGGVSRGLGHSSLTALPFDAGTRDELEVRLKGFAERIEAPDDELHFSVTLLDDAIFTDPQTGAPIVGLSPEVLTRRLRDFVSDHELPIIQAGPTWHAAQVVSGWNATWGLPKWSALATVGGSAAVFAATSLTEQQRDSLTHALYLLELQGIGARRSEGFGQVAVCHPIHWEELAP